MPSRGSAIARPVRSNARPFIWRYARPVAPERRRPVGLTRGKTAMCEINKIMHANRRTKAQSRSQTGAPVHGKEKRLPAPRRNGYCGFKGSRQRGAGMKSNPPKTARIPNGCMTKFFRRAKSSAKASASSSLPSTGRECAETNFAH